MMDNIDKFYTMCTLDGIVGHREGEASHGFIYTTDILTQARDFVEGIAAQFKSDLRTLCDYLISRTRTEKNLEILAVVFVCLRCFLSHSIVYHCKSLATKYAEKIKRSSEDVFQELLCLTLEDDGKNFLVWDFQDEICLTSRNQQGPYNPQKYEIFAMKLLRTYRPEASNRLSLKNWCRLMMTREKNVRDCLGWEPNTNEWLLMHPSQEYLMHGPYLNR